MDLPLRACTGGKGVQGTVLGRSGCAACQRGCVVPIRARRRSPDIVAARQLAVVVVRARGRSRVTIGRPFACAVARMTPRTEINGETADAESLAFLAQVNYGHFTSMQVREGGVRGLDLHLDRLAAATVRLFGRPLDRTQVRTWLRQAVGGGSASARITVYSRQLDRARLEQPVDVDVLVATTPARDPDATPLRVRSIEHARVLPAIKHVGTFELLHHGRDARLAGFDDVVFRSAAGSISEGSIWNIGFWDGAAMVLPVAPCLRGITVQLVEAGLALAGITCRRRDVRVGDFEGLQAAFAMNSGNPCRPISSIDGHAFPVDDALTATLHAAYAVQPFERV